MTAPEKTRQQVLAEAFWQLHLGNDLLILPNAWDASSAVIFEKAGFEAIGTTSAGIAYSLGYPDGEHIGFEDVLASSKQMFKSITVPLSVDMETGYGNEVAEVVEKVRQIIELGAVGINIEDGLTRPSPGLSDTGKQLELLKALSVLKQSLDIPFVINARTDVYWLEIGDPESRLSLALEKASVYAEAGADCIFVPGNLDRATIQTLLQEIPVPLNILATPGSLTVSELEQLGVARLSLGSGPVRATLGLTQRIATELKRGSFESMIQNALPYDAANTLFS